MMSDMSHRFVFVSAYRQLTPAERTFVDGVIIEFERIADRAGERLALMLHRPLPSNIVERSRGMLDKPMVTAAITERVNEISAANDLTVQRMVKEMMAIAFSSMGDYCTVAADGAVTFDLARCTPEQMSAIKSIETEQHDNEGLARPSKSKLKIVLHDKIQGLKMLGEFMGMLTAENPYWRAETARAANPSLPAGATTQEAGEAYAAMIDG